MRRKDRETKGRNETEEIISRCRTCHVAMVDDGMPYVVPLSYGYRFVDEDTLELYFHGAYGGRKMDILKRNNKVCFEVSNEGEPSFTDAPCDSGYYYSSVIGNGEVIFIHDDDAKCDAMKVILKHHTGKDISFTREQAEGVCVYKIVSADFTGKRKPRLDA